MVRTRRRPPAPAALIRNGRQWTERWKGIRDKNTGADWAARIAKQALRVPLETLTHGKCAFCEGLLGAQSFLLIDHYVSRKVDTDGVFEWQNLFPICSECNVRKGHEDHRNELLKPDAEDPEPFFWLGPEGKLDPHPALSDAERRRASETIRICGLNRGPLQKSRSRIMRQVSRWLQRQTFEEWQDLSDPATPYKLALRHVVRDFPELVEHDRRRFHYGDGLLA